jgi:hypothetical protein
MPTLRALFVKVSAASHVSDFQGLRVYFPYEKRGMSLTEALLPFRKMGG